MTVGGTQFALKDTSDQIEGCDASATAGAQGTNGCGPTAKAGAFPIASATDMEDDVLSDGVYNVTNCSSGEERQNVSIWNETLNESVNTTECVPIPLSDAEIAGIVVVGVAGIAAAGVFARFHWKRRKAVNIEKAE